MIFRKNADWLRFMDSESNTCRPCKCRNNMIMMAQFFFPPLVCKLICTWKVVRFAKGFSRCSETTCLRLSWFYLSFKQFDIIQVIWRHWSFCAITHDFVNVVSFRSINVCLILVAPWKVKVLMWPTCLSWKMVLLTCRWDKINAFLFMSRFFLVTWETVVFSLLYWTVVS